MRPRYPPGRRGRGASSLLQNDVSHLERAIEGQSALAQSGRSQDDILHTKRPTIRQPLTAENARSRPGARWKTAVGVA
jgi:hypothetical protein